MRTGKTLSDYIIDIRLGFATRLLVDSSQTIAEICYDCGFNNLSNFNRMFRKKKDARLKSFVKTIGRRKLLYNIWCICRELEEVFERMPLFLLFNANVSFEYDKIVLVFAWQWSNFVVSNL